MSLKRSWLVAFFGILLFAYSSDAMNHKGHHEKDHDQHPGEHHDGPDGPPPFEAIDADGDGTIQKAEAREFFMHQDGDEFNEAEFEEDYSRINKDGDAGVNHEEFMMEVKLQEGERHAEWDDHGGPGTHGGPGMHGGPDPDFDEIDADGSGQIPFDEAMEYFAEEQGEDFDKEEFIKGFQERDANGDGLVDEHEFDSHEGPGPGPHHGPGPGPDGDHKPYCAICDMEMDSWEDMDSHAAAEHPEEHAKHLERMEQHGGPGPHHGPGTDGEWEDHGNHPPEGDSQGNHPPEGDSHGDQEKAPETEGAW